MFDLTVNSAHEVTLVRFRGHVLARDFTELEAMATVRIAARAATDCILDFTTAESIDVPIRTLAERSEWPQICCDRRRVVVMSSEGATALVRLLASYQAFVGCDLPAVVPSLGDALNLLRCPRSGFQPIESERVRASISTLESAYVH